jgi:hypothetical protein
MSAPDKAGAIQPVEVRPKLHVHHWDDGHPLPHAR